MYPLPAPQDRQASPPFLSPAIVFSLFSLGMELGVRVEIFLLFLWHMLTLSAEQVGVSSEEVAETLSPFLLPLLASLPPPGLQINPSLLLLLESHNKRKRLGPVFLLRGPLAPACHHPPPPAPHQGGTVLFELNSDKLNIFLSRVNFSKASKFTDSFGL